MFLYNFNKFGLLPCWALTACYSWCGVHS